MFSRLLSVFIIITLGSLVQGQESYFEKSPEYTFYPSAHEIVIPGYALFQDNLASVSVFNRSRFGKFNKVRDFSAVANVNCSHKHLLELQLHARQMGPHLSSNRLYGGYGNKVKLSSNWSLGGLVQLGMVNVVMDATSAGQGGTQNVGDLNFGVFLFAQNTFLSVAGKQLFNSELAPIELVFELPNHFDVNIGHSSQLNSIYKMMGVLRVSVFDQDKQLYFVYLDHVFYEKFHLGGQLVYEQNWSVFMNIDAQSKKGSYNVGLAYISPLGSVLPVSMFEIQLKWYRRVAEEE